MVIKYHVSVDCQESYIFPRDYIFPKYTALRENIVLRENITILAPPTCDNWIRPSRSVILDGQNEWFNQNLDGALWVPQSLVTRLGVCIQNKVKANLTDLRTLLLWRSILDHCILCLRGDFFLGQSPNMEIMLLLLSPNFFLNCYLFPVGQYNFVFDRSVYARF